MANVNVFVADGMEEVECLAVCDVLLRAGMDVKLVSVMGRKEITGSHGFKIMADVLFEEITDEADLLFLPGGMPGTAHLAAHNGLAEMLKKHAADGKRLAAICAAPSVLGGLGLAAGHKVTCFPGWEEAMKDAVVTGAAVETDRMISTGRGMGCAIDLGLELVKLMISEDAAADLKKQIQYDH